VICINHEVTTATKVFTKKNSHGDRPAKQVDPPNVADALGQNGRRVLCEKSLRASVSLWFSSSSGVLFLSSVSCLRGEGGGAAA
jgi:hypothetical protein